MDDSHDMTQSSVIANHLFSTLAAAENLRENQEQMASIFHAIELLKRQNKGFVLKIHMDSMIDAVKLEAKQESNLEMQKLKKELMQEHETSMDEMKATHESDLKKLRAHMNTQLEEAKSEMEETCSIAISKLKAECIEISVKSSAVVLEKVMEKFEITGKSSQKAMTAAIAQNTSALEEKLDVLNESIMSKHDWAKVAV